MTICDTCNEIDCCCDRPVILSPDNYICSSTSIKIRHSRLCRSSHSEQDNILITMRCIQHQCCDSKELTAVVTSYNAVWVLALFIWHKLIHHRNIIFTVFSEIVMNYVYCSLYHIGDILPMPSITFTSYIIIEGGSPLCLTPINNKIDHSNKESKQTHSRTFTDKYIFGKCKKGLRIAHLNIQHIISKLDEIKYHLSYYKSNLILGLCETFLTESVNENTLHIENFITERRDRKLNKKGGGLLVYISKTIAFIRRHDLEDNNIESMWLQISLPNNKPFLLNYVYRPPNSKQEWIDLYEKQIDLADQTNFHMFLLGDLNINYIPTNYSATNYSGTFNNKKWEILVEKFGMSQMVNFPTRVTNSSSTIIDHIYCTSKSLIKDVLVPSCSASDHYPVSFLRINKHTEPKGHEHEHIHYRSFKTFDENEFSKTLANVRFSIIETINNPNAQLEVFYHLLNEVLSQHAPMKLKRVKRHKQPEWFNEEIKCAILERNRLHKRKEFTHYKMMRNKVTLLIKKSKKSFYNKAIMENKNSAELWKTLKSIQSPGDSTNDGFILPKSMSHCNNNIQGKENILNALNEHFVNISNIVEKTNYDERDFIHLGKYLHEKLRHNYFDVQFITPFEVKCIIDRLDITKSTGLDGIGPNILKYCGDYITESIAHIINSSISQGIFPDALKEAYVIPIFKGGTREDPSNYRPISILPTISKIFERHIAQQLHTFFKDTDIIHVTQSGFRKQHSCHTALTRLIDAFLREIDNGKYVGAVFLDLRKAFDLVDHQILIHKLKLYQFSDKTVHIFKSYLNNRHQKMKVNNCYSNNLKIRSGVPQGSILGPLLFLIYINDILLSSDSINIDLYADDSTIHHTDYTISDIENRLQCNLNEINHWCKQNNMSLHPGKSKCMLLSTKYKMRNARKLLLTVDSIIIENVDVYKLLGVLIDNTLSWKPQISAVCRKLNSKIALLKQIIYFLSDEMKKMFYNAYIMPCFDYCITVWGKGVKSKSDLNRILRIQKRAARIILKKPSYTCSLDMLNELNWLTFENRCAYHMGLLIYKCKNQLLPNYMTNLITFTSNETYNLRSASRNKIAQLKARTNYLKDTFSYCSTEIWNSIPLHVKKCVSIYSFKKNFKRFLMEIQNQKKSMNALKFDYNII